MLTDPAVDVKNLNINQHFTNCEKLLLEAVAPHPSGHQDAIIEHGYTGVIDANHICDIQGTLMVSIINKRMLFLSEFRKGLELFGLSKCLQENPGIFKPLFVRGVEDKVDANCLLSTLRPVYSEQGTSRRPLEESLIDHLQDFLMSLEDGEMSGYKEALAWNHDAADNDVDDHFQAADLTPAGVLGWLTGQKHKPINGDQKCVFACVLQRPILFHTIGPC